MASNKNLFYKLYSTSNKVVNSGYTCNSAIDENDTSFDIIGSVSGGSAGTITDSNGNPLSNIDLSQIHASGITQYTTETRILQPHSATVLQGQEFGLSAASYYYVIPKQLKETEGYEKYIDCDFDVIYNNFAPKRFHIHTAADGQTSFVKEINDAFKKYNILVSASIQDEVDEIDGHTYEYLVFLSQKEGYFYYINNLKVTVKFQSEDFPDSPFKKGIKQLKQFMYDLIEKYKPMKLEQTGEDSDGDGINDIVSVNPTDNYEVDCDLYTWLLHKYIDAVKDIESFRKMIDYFKMWEETGDEEWLEKYNIEAQNTVYDDDIINFYLDDTALEALYNIINDIKTHIDELNEYYRDFYWLREDRHKRIPLMKYPNGAFRGIVLIPDWPTKTDDYEYASLWVNHIKSKVKLYRPTKEHQFLPKIYGVLSNATLVKEEKDFRHLYPEFGSLGLENSVSSLTDGWDDERQLENPVQQQIKDIDTDYMDPYRPDKDVDDDLTYMGQNYYSKKKNIIGLFRYLQWVHENGLWNKVGEAYMIIGKDDDPQSHDLNLPTSLVVYNPNPDPIRIKYMIFS